MPRGAPQAFPAQFLSDFLSLHSVAFDPLIFLQAKVLPEHPRPLELSPAGKPGRQWALPPFAFLLLDDSPGFAKGKLAPETASVLLPAGTQLT